MSGNVKKHDSDQTGEHTSGDAGQLIIFILFMAAWLSDSFLNYSNFLNQYIPLYGRIPVAVLLLALSVYMAVTGMRLVFGKNRQSGVIRSGVFRFVRHPIYLAEILLYLGLLMFNISLAAVIIWIAGIVFLNYISRYEEKLLLARFGEDYKRYMKETGMWVPGIHKK